MKLEIYKSLWGMTGPLEEQLGRIKAAGYAGIETGLPEPRDRPRLRSLLRRHRLKLVGMVFTAGPDHLGSFRDQLAGWRAFRPVSVTAHTAADGMAPAAQLRFYREAAAAERASGLRVNHETHRGRAFFTPWATTAVLRAVPDLTLCADFSHWCCVCESLLEWGVEPGDLDLAIRRTRHIHARVGYAEGPQVPDPRAPEWAAALDRHEGWWRAMLAAQAKAGVRVATVTPEFGPPDYLHTLPHTRQPVADLWEICLWMKDRLRRRFG